MFQVSIATRQPFICIIFTLKHLFYRHTFSKNVVRIQIITTSDNSGTQPYYQTQSYNIFFHIYIVYKLTDTPNENVLLKGYFFPSETPNSGSQSLKSEKVNKLVPTKKTRTLFK